MEEVTAPNGVLYLRFAALEETGLVRHGFSTRIGGVSRGIYASMNFSFSRTDSREDVEEDYRRMAKALGVGEDSFVPSCQVHGTSIEKVGKKEAGLGKKRSFKEADGLITNEKGITLVTFFADCIPLFILDTKNKAIGLAHSGWRGTCGNIGEKTVRRMREEYGSRPEDLLCCIGPGICGDCYGVGEDLHDRFVEKRGSTYCGKIFFRDREGKRHLDLWEANRLNFLESGVPEKNITVSHICTYENSKTLFSHRMDGEKRGNLAAFLSLEEKGKNQTRD